MFHMYCYFILNKLAVIKLTFGSTCVACFVSRRKCLLLLQRAPFKAELGLSSGVPGTKGFLIWRMDYFSVQIEYGYGSRLVVILFQILLFIPGTYLPYIQKMMKRTPLMFAKSFDDSLTLPVHR